MKQYRYSYRARLIAFIMIVIVLVFCVGLVNVLSSQFLYGETQDLLVLSQQLTTVYQRVGGIQTEMEAFLSTRSSENLQEFYDQSNELATLNSELGQKASYTDRGIKIKNLNNMISHYLGTLDQTVIDKRNEITEKYITGYETSLQENEYIESYIQQVMNNDLSENAARYVTLQSEIDRSNTINYIILGVTLTLVVLGTLFFAYQITKPIYQLSDYANAITEGKFDIQVEEDTSSAEMNSLFRAFKKMATSISKHVDELKERQRLEKKLSEAEINSLKMETSLHEAEINSLKMETSLREAELQTLQYQVNPHFIFNTINIGAKIAMLQNDQVTCDYLETAADVFRYNLKSMATDVTLAEEMRNIDSYMNLLTTRFGDMLKFIKDVPDDEQIKNFRMPPMILQPLVENAYIHGISKMENGGEIVLFISKNNGGVNITISNTGPPIPIEKVVEILKNEENTGEEEKITVGGHTTNIGIGNVLQRLRLYYGVNDVMNIICGGGRTNFILKLPDSKAGPDEGEAHV